MDESILNINDFFRVQNQVSFSLPPRITRIRDHSGLPDVRFILFKEQIIHSETQHHLNQGYPSTPNRPPTAHTRLSTL